MSHTIEKSLAGTAKNYVVVDANKGLRVRKLSSSRLRIHIEKEAPQISSRSRLESGYKVPYWAMDVDTKGLLEAVDLATGGVVADAPVEKVVAKPLGFENALAQIVFKVDELDSKKVSVSTKIKEFEKIQKETSAERKKLLALKKRLTNGMVAYKDAQELLAE